MTTMMIFNAMVLVAFFLLGMALGAGFVIWSMRFSIQAEKEIKSGTRTLFSPPDTGTAEIEMLEKEEQEVWKQQNPETSLD